MYRKAVVCFKGLRAGVLSHGPEGFAFEYDKAYLQKPGSSSISLTLKKREEPYYSPVLFPFFSNMLSEGMNRNLQCRLLSVDVMDSFSLLLEIAHYDTIGAVTVHEI